MTRARKVVITLLSALPVLLLPALPAPAASSDAGYNNSRMLEFMNDERQARGIRTVARDSALDQKAQAWAEKLAAEGKMYHSSSYAGMSAGYRSAAQNLAYHDDSLSASQAHNMWMASGVHRKNMLDPDFSHVGVAIACSSASGRPYVMAVVEFGGDGSPSHSTPPRNPQVAGGSGNARAMSCDNSPAPAAATAPPATAPEIPSTTEVNTTSSKPSPTTPSAAVRAPAKLTTSTAVKKSTTTRPATTSTRPTTAAAVAAPAEIPGDTTTTTSPDPILAGLAAAQGSPKEGLDAVWLTSFAAASGAVLIAQIRRKRRTQHVPKHSMGRRRS
ncbi:MAG: CAP domain-containing protein [Actinomycetota bacterium]